MKTLIKIKYRSLFILGVLILISCKPSDESIEQRNKNIIAEVKQTLNNYFQDIKKHGLTAEFKYLDPSPDFFWTPPGYSVSISFDSVARILKENAPKFSSIDNSFDTLHIIPLSATNVVYTGRIKSIMKDTSGRENTIILTETGVLIKRKNQWKLLCGQTNILDHPD